MTEIQVPTKRCLTGQRIAPRLDVPTRPVRAMPGSVVALALTLGACALLEVVRRVYEWRLP